MATIRSNPNGRREVLVYCSDGKRRSIRLGICDDADAAMASKRIQELAHRQGDGEPPSRQLLAWLNSIPALWRQRLIKADLIEIEADDAPSTRPTLNDLIKHFEETTADRKASTRGTYQEAIRNLRGYFESTRRIDSVSPIDAAKWRASLTTIDGLAPATIARRTGIARQIFNVALRAKWIESNPFHGLPVRVLPNPDLQKYVEPSVIADCLAACDTPQDVVTIALARFAGLRCPSEVAALKWADVKKDHFFIAKSSKIEHHAGGGRRRVPLFPDLIAAMDAARRARTSDYVVGSNRVDMKKFRRRFIKIIKSTGHPIWPKLYNNLRASAIRDLLTDTHDVKQTAAWLGTSEEVIMKHYLAILEGDREADLVSQIKPRL